MPTNAIVAVEQEEHDLVVIPMSLVRLSSWMTNTAHLAKGDIIQFDSLGIDFEVISIVHQCKSPVGKISPATLIYLKPHRSLFDDEIEKMRSMGFES